MIRRPPRSTRTDTTVPYTTLFRSTQTLSFVQDALGRLTSQTGPQGTIGYTYDAAGRRLTMSYPGGTLTINYDYDTVGNVTKIRENGATRGGGGLATYAFDRSEERRVGRESVSTCRSRGSPYN